VSIADKVKIADLERRVAALESAQLPVHGQQHADEVIPVVPEALKGKTLTLPEKRKPNG
jgi:hypothetical protein